MSEKKVAIVGGGLAGSEAAWQLGRMGISSNLYEMRPNKNPRPQDFFVSRASLLKLV